MQQHLHIEPIACVYIASSEKHVMKHMALMQLDYHHHMVALNDLSFAAEHFDAFMALT